MSSLKMECEKQHLQEKQFCLLGKSIYVLCSGEHAAESCCQEALSAVSFEEEQTAHLPMR